MRCGYLPLNINASFQYHGEFIIIIIIIIVNIIIIIFIVVIIIIIIIITIMSYVFHLIMYFCFTTSQYRFITNDLRY